MSKTLGGRRRGHFPKSYSRSPQCNVRNLSAFWDKHYNCYNYFLHNLAYF